MQNFAPLILLLPLAGFVVLGLFGRALPRMAISLVACGTVLAAFVLAVVNFAGLVNGTLKQQDIPQWWTWATSGALRIDFGLLLDPLSAVMLLVVTGVGFLIHVYSIGYMEDDPGYWRFFAFMNLFVFAMTLLVTADNFLFLLVGWAGVGLASFLLIGFWYTRPSAVAAARKAFVVNVIGDFGLLLAIFLIFRTFGTLAYSNVLPRIGTCPQCSTTAPSLLTPTTHVFDYGVFTAIALLLFVAAAAKSAQLPLHVWLPDAMEGPTPVSALIHAATMVTAGVYLVARTANIFLSAPNALAVVGAVAGVTAIFAATIACVQTDIKRVLAYSTMSQLGYMFMGEAAGGFSGGIFHLTTHAYFKALLFMCAGAVIHVLGGEQDMRKMGGLRARLQWTWWLFVVGGLALAAIFPFAGFWSKDAILGTILGRATSTGAFGWYLLYAVGLVTAALTGFYIFRLIFGVFLGSYRGGEIAGHGPSAAGGRGGSRDPLAQVHEAGPVMLVPMLILGVLSLVGGFYGLPGADRIGGFLASVAPSAEPPAPDSGTFWLSLALGLLAAVIGIAVAWVRYGARQPSFAPSRNPLVTLLEHRYYVDDLYDAVFVRPVVALGALLQRGLEDDTLDGGTRGLGWLVVQTGRGLRALQTGYARNYALAIFLGAALILLFYVVHP
jgi:NADH-quinone oxidoreductase subunit L